MTDEELPQCQFCGSDDAWLVNLDGGNHAGASYFGCINCGAWVAMRFDRREILVSNWRTEPTTGDSVMETFAAFATQCNRVIASRVMTISARVRRV